jgi:hypothetical protein
MTGEGRDTKVTARLRDLRRSISGASKAMRAAAKAARTVERKAQTKHGAARLRHAATAPPPSRTVVDAAPPRKEADGGDEGEQA